MILIIDLEKCMKKNNSYYLKVKKIKITFHNILLLLF